MPRDSDKFVWQTRLFVVMRRVCTRVIDLEYLRTNTTYAQEILQLAEDSNDSDLLEISGRLRVLMNLPGGKRPPAAAPAPAIQPPQNVPPAATGAINGSAPAAAPAVDMQAVIAQVAQQVAARMLSTGQIPAPDDLADGNSTRYVGSLR